MNLFVSFPTDWAACLKQRSAYIQQIKRSLTQQQSKQWRPQKYHRKNSSADVNAIFALFTSTTFMSFASSALLSASLANS